jgi:hypothetical protein
VVTRGLYRAHRRPASRGWLTSRWARHVDRAQYGTPDVARYGGTIISAPVKNPQFSGLC